MLKPAQPYATGNVLSRKEEEDEVERTPEIISVCSPHLATQSLSKGIEKTGGVVKEGTPEVGKKVDVLLPQVNSQNGTFSERRHRTRRKITTHNEDG